MKIIHISDLHIDSAVHADDGREIDRLNALVKEIIRANYPKGTVVVITGDLTNNGMHLHNTKEKNPVYEKVQELKNAGFEVLVIPGNHDYGNGIHPMPNKNKLGQAFKEIFYNDKNATYPRIDTFENTVFIGVDTVLACGILETLSMGKVGKDQINSVKNALNNAKQSNKKTVVYLHYNPFKCKYSLKLNDRDDFINAINGKTDLLLFGHIHVGDTGLNANCNNLIPRAYNAGSSTDTDNKDDWQPSYRVIDLDESASNDRLINFSDIAAIAGQCVAEFAQ